MFMYNSENIPKKKKETIKDITRGLTVDHKWSTVKIPCLSKTSTDKDKAYVTNYFLNNYFFDKTEKQLLNMKDFTTPEALYKYRVIFKDQDVPKYASFSSVHSALASVVLDLPPVENENDIIKSLRKNVSEMKERFK